MAQAFLGLDLGTSSVKALLLAEDGEIVAQSQENYEFDVPQAGWAEHSADFWWEASSRVIRAVSSSQAANSFQIKALSFSGQMHGLVSVDKEGRAIRPAIIWCDQRSHKELAYLKERFTLQEWQEMTGNPVATGFLLPSLLWLRENESESYMRINRVLLPKDYLRFRMTGKICTDYSDASGTGAYHVAKAAWSLKLLDALNIDSSIFPPLVAAAHDCGTLLPHIASELGLSQECRVICGAADQVMQAVGNGIVQEGSASVTIGTGGQILAVLSKPPVLEQLNAHVCSFLDEKSFFFLGANLSAGLALRWLRDHVLLGLDYKEMDALAESVAAGSEGLTFLPYLLGERTPHMDPLATASFSGLRFKHTRAHMIRALLEGVAFALKESFELIPATIKIQELFISGGGAQSPLWRQIVADVLEHELLLASGSEQAALGAAIIAAYGSKSFDSLLDAVKVLVKPALGKTNVDATKLEPYREAFLRYKAQYPIPSAHQSR